MHLCPSATCDVSEHVIRHNVIIHLVDVSRMQACLRVRESELVAPCTFLAFFEVGDECRFLRAAWSFLRWHACANFPAGLGFGVVLRFGGSVLESVAWVLVIETATHPHRSRSSTTAR